MLAPASHAFTAPAGTRSMRLRSAIRALTSLRCALANVRASAHEAWPPEARARSVRTSSRVKSRSRERRAKPSLATARLADIAMFSVGRRGVLLVIGALGLTGGAGLLWRQQRAAAACGSDGVSTPPAVRVLTLVGLVIGAGLLWAGYAYA